MSSLTRGHLSHLIHRSPIIRSYRRKRNSAKKTTILYLHPHQTLTRDRKCLLPPFPNDHREEEEEEEPLNLTHNCIGSYKMRFLRRNRESMMIMIQMVGSRSRLGRLNRWRKKLSRPGIEIPPQLKLTELSGMKRKLAKLS